MNRFLRLFFRWTAAFGSLLTACSVQAQVTVGTDPNSAKAKIAWPTVYYTAIDASSDAQGNHDVEQVLIGEDGKIVFSYRTEERAATEDDTEADPAADDDIIATGDDPDNFTIGYKSVIEYHVCTWQAGSSTTDQSTILRSSIVYEDPNPAYDITLQYSYHDMCITPSGQIFGRADLFHVQGGYQFLFDGSSGSIQRFSLPEPLYSSYSFFNDIAYHDTVLVGVSGSGDFLVETFTPLADQYDGNPTAYASGGSTVFGYGTAESGSVDKAVQCLPIQANKNGYAIGIGADYFGYGYGHHYIWGSQYVDVDLDLPEDLNDGNQAVVYSDGTVANPNSGGYLWEDGPSGGTRTYLHDVLPEYLKAQVTDIQPLMISEKATDGTFCIFGYVVEGDDWSYMVCTRDGSGAWSFAKMILPAGYNIAAINSGGLIAGTGTVNNNTSQQNTQKSSSALSASGHTREQNSTSVSVLLLEPISFTVTNWNPLVTQPTIKYVEHPTRGWYYYIDAPDEDDSIMKVSASVRIDLSDIGQADILAKQWDLVLFQDIVFSNPGAKFSYSAGKPWITLLSGLPGQDSNVATQKVSASETAIPRTIPFDHNHEEIASFITDSPAQFNPAYINRQGRGQITDELRNNEFVTYLFAERRSDHYRVFLKWVRWRSHFEVAFDFSQNPWVENRRIWEFKILGQGNGAGSIPPVDTPYQTTEINP